MLLQSTYFKCKETNRLKDVKRYNKLTLVKRKLG